MPADMNTPDIVERLRDYDSCTDSDIDEAADEIERLHSLASLALPVLQECEVYLFNTPLERALDVRDRVLSIIAMIEDTP